MGTTTEKAGIVTLAVADMTCGHCVQAVTRVLAAVPGVTPRSVEVGLARIEVADGSATARAVAALEDAGFPATPRRDVDGELSPARPASGGGCGR